MKEQEVQRKFNLKKLLIAAFIWVLILSPAFGVLFLLNLADDESLPNILELENPKTDLASVILSSDLQQLGKYYHENRTNTHFNQLPQSLIDALIATEDERFFDHSGIDVRALGRVVKGVLTGNLKGGGSTISQQLAKLLFPRK